MSKIIDITDKLSFDEKPKIKIKGEEYEVNDSAITMLKILPLLKGETSVDALNEIFEKLFDEKSRAKIEALNLNFKDFSTFVMEAVKLVSNSDEEPGETQTPATT